MSMRTILVAVLLLAAGGLGWFSLRSVDPTPVSNARAAQAPPTKVLVAAQALQAGTLLKDADMREREYPADAVPPNAMVADDANRAEIRGAMLRQYLDANQLISRADVLRPKDRGFLAAVLQPGTRAISIGVDARTGASGLISPGDLVDVILAQEFAPGDTPAGRRVVAETVLSMVRVIAVDQQITQGAPTGSSPLPTGAAARVASTVSLQVTPEQAARLVVAERLGKLTLVVRSIDSDPAAKPANVADGTPTVGRAEPAAAAPASVFGADVSAALSREEPAASPRLKLIQGDTVNDVVFH